MTHENYPFAIMDNPCRHVIVSYTQSFHEIEILINLGNDFGTDVLKYFSILKIKRLTNIKIIPLKLYFLIQIEIDVYSLKDDTFEALILDNF